MLAADRSSACAMQPVALNVGCAIRRYSSVPTRVRRETPSGEQLLQPVCIGSAASWRHGFHTLHTARHVAQWRYSTQSVRISTRGSLRAHSGHGGRARRSRRRSSFIIRTGSSDGHSAMAHLNSSSVPAKDARRTPTKPRSSTQFKNDPAGTGFRVPATPGSDLPPGQDCILAVTCNRLLSVGYQ
jgi:hypothetical protein